MLCWLSSPVAEATDGRLRCFISVNVNASGLEGPVGDQRLGKKSIASGLLLLSFACHLALLSRLDDPV